MSIPNALTFGFRPDEGETQESLARKRKIAEALLQQSTSAVPRNVGEGLTAIGQALAGRFATARLDKQPPRVRLTFQAS